MITFTELRKFFLSLVFNPAKEGPMKVIVDVGDPHYYLTRALEMLQESRRDGLSDGEREVLRIRAIQLLALNVLNGRTKIPKRKPKKAASDKCGVEGRLGLSCILPSGHEGPHKSDPVELAKLEAQANLQAHDGQT